MSRIASIAANAARADSGTSAAPRTKLVMAALIFPATVTKPTTDAAMLRGSAMEAVEMTATRGCLLTVATDGRAIVRCSGNSS